MENKTILIVGGSKGIGFFIVKEAIKKYRNVYVISRQKSKELNDLPINFIAHDINNNKDTKNLLENINPDILILCVAKGLYGYPETLLDSEIEAVFNTTYMSNIFWIKNSLQVLKCGSKIAWLSSLTAKLPDLNWCFYASAKAGVEHFVESIRENSKNISITLCYPGVVNTGFHENSGSKPPLITESRFLYAKELLEAVENKEDFWSSPLDKNLVEVLNKSKKDLLLNFKGYLK